MITAARLRELLSYDPMTGLFINLTVRGGVQKGGIAGSLDAEGYRVIRVSGKHYKAHRLAFLYMTDDWPANQVDHKNGCLSDNRWENLREADNGQNQQNLRLRRDNSSGLFGVSWHKDTKKWVAQIQVNHEKRCLGYFVNKDDAYAAYCAAKAVLHTFNPSVRGRANA